MDGSNLWDCVQALIEELERIRTEIKALNEQIARGVKVDGSVTIHLKRSE